MSSTQFLAPGLRDDEEEVERSLRPRRLDEFVGQARVKEQLAIVLELKEKLGDPSLLPAAEAGGDAHIVARDALVELGWSLLDAERVLAEVDPELAPEERVRLALKRAA